MFSNDLLDPQPGVTFFNSANEVATVIFNEMTTQLSIVKDLKIDKALPANGKKQGNRRNLESWRTGQSFLFVLNNLLAVKNSYDLGFSTHVTNTDETDTLDALIKQQFDESVSIAEQLYAQSDQGLAAVMKDEEFLGRLRELQLVIQSIEKNLKGQVAPMLSLSLKFNALDGD